MNALGDDGIVPYLHTQVTSQQMRLAGKGLGSPHCFTNINLNVKRRYRPFLLSAELDTYRPSSLAPLPLELIHLCTYNQNPL